MVRIKNTMCGQRSAGWKRLAIIKVSILDLLRGRQRCQHYLDHSGFKILKSF